MQYFPLFLDLSNKAVLVVGGGEVACRKIDALLRAGARVTIVSPQIEQYLYTLVEQGKCEWIQNFYSPSVLSNRFVQVWATTDNPDLNHQVHKDAKNIGVLVNVVDDLPYCDFITPSMINRGRIQIAISSGGASPVLVRNVRETLESVLPQNLGLLAEFGASKRTSIKERLPTVDLRRKFWEMFFAIREVKDATSREQLEVLYRATLEKDVENLGDVTWIEYGSDVELLPMKAMRYMQQAELVLFEKGCSYDVIDLCRRDAEREEFSSPAQLGERLKQAKQDRQRICVLVSQLTQEFSLLHSQQRVIKPGSEKK
ncbi:precorrin-2 dehydrogenase/sirohydrochlorin ferrochelatase family protein [Vibrio diazotrophicus]|uniref:precorrin-2 dehydrogenase n=1 Tax=Vibrio diazotrophicus TaxID=685 RepID=A0ABX4WDV6_VIBDI|nr:bifunctional precorrin-2 dehydrogenase/sirohydrochlorin ferrochelatase [Vibrio diazotrophicus]PNH90164.1 siroheme synthase [Vibrio diazotrophicus]PNI02217.1 siroheme synthase [Vibrio diazotrophicus]